MIIVDTSIWIEYFKCHQPVFTEMEKLLSLRHVIAVEVIFAELFQGAKNKREREQLHRLWKNLPRIETKELLIQAGEFAGNHSLYSKGIGLVDAAILWAAREQGYQIWTLDNKLSSQLQEHEIFTMTLKNN